MIVMKFGGTSVSSLERWQTIAEVIRSRVAEGLTPLVVCSAVSRVSRLLEKLLKTLEILDLDPWMLQKPGSEEG